MQTYTIPVTQQPFALVVMLEMGNTKPFVQVACVCENILREADGVASLIRLVDVFGIERPDAPPGQVPLLPLKGYLSLRAGDLKGSYEVGLLMRRPDGTRANRKNLSCVFNGASHGVNFLINLGVENPKAGIYWLDVLWGDEVLTSIPFELKILTPELKPFEAQPTTTQPTNRA